MALRGRYSIAGINICYACSTISLFELANKYAASENDSKEVASGNHREPKPNFSTLFTSNASFFIQKMR